MLPMYFLNDFEMVPVAPIITGITVVFTFHIRWICIVRSLYFKIFFSFFFNYITVSWDGNIYQYACPLFTISDYNTWLIIRNSFVRSYLLIPQYGDLSPLSCFYCFWHMFVPVFCIQLHSHFLTDVVVQLCPQSIMPFDVLFLCKYWARRYYMIYSLIKFLAEPACAHNCAYVVACSPTSA